MGFRRLYPNQKPKVMCIPVVLNHTPFKVKNQQSPASGASEGTRESVVPVPCGPALAARSGGLEGTRCGSFLTWSQGPVQASHWPPCVPSGRRVCRGRV